MTKIGDLVAAFRRRFIAAERKAGAKFGKVEDAVVRAVEDVTVEVENAMAGSGAKILKLTGIF